MKALCEKLDKENCNSNMNILSGTSPSCFIEENECKPLYRAYSGKIRNIEYVKQQIGKLLQNGYERFKKSTIYTLRNNNQVLKVNVLDFAKAIFRERYRSNKRMIEKRGKESYALLKRIFVNRKIEYPKVKK